MQILKMQVADQEIIKDKFEQLQGEVVKVGSKVIFYEHALIFRVRKIKK